jgi:hypothetical protein
VRRKNLTLALLLSVCSSLAGAQAVYRCGNSYSQQPCDGGARVAAADQRTPAQAQNATRVANADARLADRMEKARLAQEKNAPKALIIGPQAAASAPNVQPEKKKAAKGKHRKQPEHFTAVAPKR